MNDKLENTMVLHRSSWGDPERWGGWWECHHPTETDRCMIEHNKSNWKVFTFQHMTVTIPKL